MKTVRKGTIETPENEPIILLHVLLSDVQKASSGSERQDAVLAGGIKNSCPRPRTAHKPSLKAFVTLG